MPIMSIDQLTEATIRLADVIVVEDTSSFAVAWRRPDRNHHHGETELLVRVDLLDEPAYAEACSRLTQLGIHPMEAAPPYMPSGTVPSRRLPAHASYTSTDYV